MCRGTTEAVETTTLATTHFVGIDATESVSIKLSSLFKLNRVLRGFRATRIKLAELPGRRNLTCLAGAIRENGDRFFSRFEEYVAINRAKTLHSRVV